MKKEKSIYLKCEYGCETLVVNKIKWQDDELNYEISIKNSYLGWKEGTIWNRIKRAFRVLCGKETIYADIWVEDESRLSGFIDDLIKLRDEQL